MLFCHIPPLIASLQNILPFFPNLFIGVHYRGIHIHCYYEIRLDYIAFEGGSSTEVVQNRGKEQNQNRCKSDSRVASAVDSDSDSRTS